MSELEKLSERMRSDWDRRIRHDYRFWMSDGYADDAAMWESGERDLAILTEGMGDTSQKSFLEIGCGVGRLLRAASGRFKFATGCDVAEEAIERAKALLTDRSNVRLLRGNGYDLKEIPAASIDFAISFASLTSMPVVVAASYLSELRRIIIPTGAVKLQLYLGRPQSVSSEDTLHLRCYREGDFREAARLAGFAVSDTTELKLPFPVSLAEMGVLAVIVTLSPMEQASRPVPEIAQALLPEGEGPEAATQTTGDLEYWMTLRYADELATKGDFEKARATLEFALASAKNTSLDVQDLLDRIVKKIDAAGAKPISPPVVSIRLAWEVNGPILERRFPEVAKKLRECVSTDQVEVRSSEDGPVLWLRGQCLDHGSKPKSAGDAWVRRLLAEARFSDAETIVVVGLGLGYHIAALAAQGSRRIAVYEPSIEAAKRAFENRDLSAILERISVLQVGEDVTASIADENSELAVRPQHLALFGSSVEKVKSFAYGKRGIKSLHPTIAVVGPFEGGTLPIAGYSTRALIELKQRIRQMDVSGFANGVKVIDRMFFSQAKKATSTGMYCEMVSSLVLESIDEKPVDVVLCMAQAPLTGKALTELRRRGIVTALWFVEDFRRFLYWREMAQFYDYVFTIQKEPALSILKLAGAGSVHYVPTACDPAIHAPVSISAEEKARWGSPISFVGAGYYNRQQTFASFADMPFKIWGTEWPQCRPFDKLVQESGRRLQPEEYNKIFNATDININLHSSSERDGVEPNGDFLNPRTFELAAAGGFQLVDERTLLGEAFEIGKEVITFSDVYDLKQKIAYYLNKPEERAAVVQRARERVLRDHTYRHRLEQMLSIIYTNHYERLRQREDQSPWKPMIVRSRDDKELSDRCQRAFLRGEDPTLDSLVVDIVNGKGKLTETEMKLLFLHHVNKQITYMRAEESGGRPQ